MTRLALLACLVGLACKKDDSPQNAAAKTEPTAETIAGDPCAKAKPHGPLAWFEDDYHSALACAKQKRVPLVLDLWAPWCHTCLSMKTTVFTDPAFAADADKFVFAALDTDRESNAEAVGKFAISAWPTFYVIGSDEAVLARFIGAATVAQFRELLASGARAAAGGVGAADARLLGAHRALAKRDFSTADEELTAALAAAPDAWLQRAEAVSALVMVKSKRGDISGCLDVAATYMAAAGSTALGTNFVSYAFGCAEKAIASGADKAAAKAAARGTAIRTQGIARLQQILADRDAPLSVDDRAEAMGYLRDALAASGALDAAKQTAEQLRALLDDAMDKAATPLEAMTHLWLRCEVYAWLGRPLDLVPAVEKLAAQLPREYDPPARLGWLYLKAGKLDEAATWTDKALALVYGPRKGRVLAQRAEIAAAAGDTATARRYREQAVKLWESLPPGQQSPDNLEKAKAALAALDAPVPANSSPKH